VPTGERLPILPKRSTPKWGIHRTVHPHTASELREKVREEVASLLHARHGTGEALDRHAEKIIKQEHQLPES